MTSTLILVFFRGHCSHPIWSLSSPDDHCIQQIQSLSRSDGGSAPRDDLYSSERQRSPGQIDEPETDLQWGPHHLDSHRGKTPGTSGALTLWLCCSWNKLLVRLAGEELPPRLSLVSPKVFSPFCHRWSFRSLPLSPLACLVGDTSFPAISQTWLHRYYLNWTELDNDITELNNEIPLTEKWAFNLVILH